MTKGERKRACRCALQLTALTIAETSQSNAANGTGMDKKEAKERYTYFMAQINLPDAKDVSDWCGAHCPC